MLSIFTLGLIAICYGQNDPQEVERLLKGFFKMTSNYRLTPHTKSNYASVFESDLVLTKLQMDDIIETFQARISGRPPRTKRNAAIIGEKFRWPNAVVPYEFKDNNTEWQSIIRKGIYKWQKETCIRFVHRTNQKDYTVFFRGGGCYSNVGRTGGRQYISIGYGCEGVSLLIKVKSFFKIEVYLFFHYLLCIDVSFIKS
uniref:ZnMc domain-containing protein n=1 Tax=Heterorhabditis bacteriophora TaxID=37862 RepID=A0A1I7WJM1_HETBA